MVEQGNLGPMRNFALFPYAVLRSPNRCKCFLLHSATVCRRTLAASPTPPSPPLPRVKTDIQIFWTCELAAFVKDDGEEEMALRKVFSRSACQHRPA